MRVSSTSVFIGGYSTGTFPWETRNRANPRDDRGPLVALTKLIPGQWSSAFEGYA